ncbi:MAG: hypothetical protein JW809_03150 [Pirellulales bacterium]|nr:hypothetical protein [Pirellulales bacterium]
MRSDAARIRIFGRALPRAGLLLAACLLLCCPSPADDEVAAPSRTWPQAYSVERDDAQGTLTLRTPFYTIQQALSRGGAIARIALTHGKAANLLVQPIAARVRDDSGAEFTDLADAAPRVEHRRDGLNEIVTVACALKGPDGRDSVFRMKSTLEYRWGYVKIRREIQSPPGARVREVCPFATVLAPSLSSYGYREGTTEEEGAPPFSFGSNLWGKLRVDRPSDPALETRYVPRSMLFADPGTEGIEWFAGSELAQWDLQLSGRRGQGRCALVRSTTPPGLALTILPLSMADAAVTMPETCVFDFYVAFPILDGQARPPWLHTTFNRNRGDWAPTDQIERWAKSGIQTVHCHNDGDYYGDGLFWRDGAYPPYPDMDRYDKVLADCRRVGIRTATYFSNKELHPSTKEFQRHGQTWARKNRKGDLQHNMFAPEKEFGAQMCLESGWLDYLKLSIDRVLANHPLDGVYYDWNVALLCHNPLHEKGRGEAGPAQGHWDIDGLLDLMEWTRRRVGPKGLVIIHNTTTPMFATENFADYVVATEWGYPKWGDRAPDLEELPLEFALVRGVSRGVIRGGLVDNNAPARLRRVFALDAILSGVTPWPVDDETFELLSRLEPLGDVATYRFADWRNEAVTLSGGRCASAVFSRGDGAYLLVANLDASPCEVTCALVPEKLPCPLTPSLAAARLPAPGAGDSPGQVEKQELDARQLIGQGIKIPLAGDEVTVIQVWVQPE